MTAHDPYAVLGVRPGASREEIHQAWIHLARVHHPDHGGDPDAMRAVNEAWEALSTAAPAGGTSGDRRRAEAGSDDTAQSTEAESWLDPRPLLPSRRSPMDLLPVAVFATAVGTGCVALVLDEPALLGVAGFLFFLSCVAIAAAAMLAMRRSARASRR